ncbi:protein-glutamine gamma-glutamyltransferase 2 isoform X2 [Thamnophis elegans]|uniref:protein-glutamine gamma-glutamyltransferase 2 isoform X2 n=1 Tax=Thamnophis elegans TaxID=35005 RepID=UPI0013765CBE|nr:protein-glutamine gamma-glutamyltransferase 2 isoform X2 [Thamnophis elegans]
MAEDLQLETWDLKCEENNLKHKTAEMGSHQLLVRRGQPFRISLTFAGRAYEAGVDKLTFVTETGPCPIETSGTRSPFPLSCSLEGSAWSSAVEQQDGLTLSVSISSPPDARIGRYRLVLDASTQFQGSSFNLGEFVLLFNPWCPEDSTYMENNEDRVEYVLTQQGLIYQGSKDYIIPIPWNFGQFEEDILDICLQLLDTNPKFLLNQDKDCSRRNSPVYISRVVSAMVNCNDDKGVLFGRWDNRYADGISPTTWSGSVDILRRWQKYGCQPVRYGQCWVFAAVACTVLRCLGIPTRVVTNYNSAHDTNGNLTIEQYLDENGKLQKGNRELIWNYHCWVECWMARPDLPSGYDGWQALDPTPQEKSEGVYCCGPTPVKAVKDGQLDFKYDVKFVFAEVNAEVAYLMLQSDMSRKKTIHPTFVGKNISTKSVGKDTKEDITHTYKHREDSEEERASFEQAKHEKMPALQEEGLALRIKASEGMNNGCDFDVFVVISNNTPEEQPCRLRISAATTSYNGELGSECGYKDLLNVNLEPNAERTVPLRILYEKYGNCLTPDNMIKVTAVLQQLEQQKILLGVRDFHIKNPDVKIRVLGEPMQNRKLVAELTLSNPLPTALTSCVFTMEGAGLTGGQKVQQLDTSVEPGEEAKVRIDFVPQQSGLRKLVVDFESDHLKGVKGYRNVIIAPLRK